MLGRGRAVKNSSGDTIVEVMVAIVVAGLALAIAYQLSNASLRTSVQSSQRSQALSVSSTQIERMKVVYNNSLPGGPTPGYFDIWMRKTGPTFCVGSTGNYIASSSGNCNNFENSIFTVADTYNNTNNADTFIITVSWPNINGHGNDQQVLYYRFPK